MFSFIKLNMNNICFLKVNDYILDDVKFFFNEFNIKLHNILYISKEDLKKNRQNASFSNSIHPFDIKIDFIDNLDILYGAFQPIFFGDIKDMTSLKVAFSNYIMSKKVTDLSSSILGHEIIHTQLLSSNSLNNYLNYEVLSLFFEKIYLYYCKRQLTLVSELLKLSILSKSIILLENEKTNYSKILYLSMIINSIVIAENIFNKYINGTNKDRDYIKNGIQNVLDGDVLLESFLDIIDASYYKSLDVALIKNNLNILS